MASIGENGSHYRLPGRGVQAGAGSFGSIRAVAVVLVYATDPVVRDQVRLAIGRSPAAGVDNVTYVDTVDEGQVVRAADEGIADLLILDGEAWPTGGLGLCRQLKNELSPCPPTIVLIGRRDDRWLGQWSQADAVVMHPIDAIELARTAVTLLNPPVAAAAAEKERTS